MASLASSGISFFRSDLAPSCSLMGGRVRRKTAANSAQLLDEAHVDDADRLQPRPRRLDPEQARGLAALDAAPELLLRGEQQVLVERIGMEW